MFPYLTPHQIRLENQRQTASSINAQVRAELEARLSEESEMRLLAQDERPARRFNFRAMRIRLPQMPFLKLQRNLK
jgi:hypothetical protein